MVPARRLLTRSSILISSGGTEEPRQWTRESNKPYFRHLKQHAYLSQVWEADKRKEIFASPKTVRHSAQARSGAPRSSRELLHEDLESGWRILRIRELWITHGEQVSGRAAPLRRDPSKDPRQGNARRTRTSFATRRGSSRRSIRPTARNLQLETFSYGLDPERQRRKPDQVLYVQKLPPGAPRQPPPGDQRCWYPHPREESNVP